MALMVEIHEDEDPEIPLRAFREVRSRLAPSRLREAAQESGSDRMTLEEINEEIAAARKERRRAHE